MKFEYIALKTAEEVSSAVQWNLPVHYHQQVNVRNGWRGRSIRCKRCCSSRAGCELMFVAVVVIILISFTVMIGGDVFTVGYITGSQRRPGDREYARPGLQISGAITLATEEVNELFFKRHGHKLQFEVAETYGEEVSSIRKTADLWTNDVIGYIGPQETCVHEGRMAAAFNLPMISYFCTHNETSNKKHFPTFARTRPPDLQISKSVVSLLLACNWTQVTFFYRASDDAEYDAVAETLKTTLKSNGVRIRAVRTWSTIYHHGYSSNPFDRLVDETFMETRIYLVLGHHDEHIGLLVSLWRKELLAAGEYFVVGVDLEQYDAALPKKYMHGLLQPEPDRETVQALQHYLGVVPSAPIMFEEFAVKVNKYLELPPFNYRNPLVYFGGVKQIRAEAAYLYDAVHLYANALLRVLLDGGNPKNGTAIIEAIKGRAYVSAMGYLIHIDENGDATGNYTILARKPIPSTSSEREYGLVPVGRFSTPNANQATDIKLFDTIEWVGSGPPIAEPLCGFRGEKCISYTGEISAGVAGGALLLLGVVSLVLYRNWRYEQELDSLLWKVDFKDIQMHENEKETAGQKLTRTTHPLVRTSQASLSSNPDTDFRYSTIFTPIGLYKGQLYAIKYVRKKSIDITREMKKELKLLRDMRHDNLNAFIGACTDPPNICIITDYCTRGSLKDVLENEDVKLDNMFTASLVADILRGMIYLHDSPLHFHGSLRTSNCLIDSRWVVKLSDFGLYAFKQGAEDVPGEKKKFEEKSEKLLYRAPELLRAGPSYCVAGTPKGDIYSFGIVLYEIFTRRGPFGEIECTAAECLKRILHPLDPNTPFRPAIQPLETSFDCVRECLKECWAEKPEDRPDFKIIRNKLRVLRKGMKPNIFDNMMAMMEKYTNNLEQLVDERTDQLQEEKKKTEALLLEMLPRPVAEQLKRGHKVEAESYDLVTIYFSDIVGFTSMSAESTPLQVVDFLNDLYTCFDSIIGHYDVYKVETIGDAYMVVSGLPIRNGLTHAGEIASMSLQLLDAVSEFKIRHRPDDRLYLRIGIHSGPVCAGVVGLKMPRYCLFGDTVNTASRMESTGLPLKIHCSLQTKEILDSLEGYHFEDRGLISMKGKGEQRTFWLVGEDPEARAKRTQERSERRGSRALNKYLGMLKSQNSLAGVRSSLKNRAIAQRSSLPRSSSLESPKRLRFASGSMLEQHRYHRYSDDALMEVISDSSTRKSDNSLADTEDITSSCPCIDHLGMNSDRFLIQSCPTVTTPLLTNTIST
ncbi:guanylate cyclase 32E [Topomyia yanbarensis]|uniref:guanylate cyclase 32E n=1 Tax=Topomyia yanbarensis TaxID=2498891 RepID=UPI00273C9CA7|nr:guanylate cyclase 32E [Topomyia yanbarensis]XP_058835408.1 guanylate cyclase 32E [Topomyia yanbarensis]XP_058835409.1 guanylate cyclase 32E [Topomyia yanbarensis]XP_058835410.1 guanylate cyclase 32E [Topomyia yanbarensis]XP_058835411.1 guanylate cyclase 32E [Topomyia yanbarensis]XP_058835412.1 guanylate cyclase 32E [Topomyia yanbarensis]XP_058835413.1 guanylate cyclase 32E [Topomyia yanbarensis]XP_058835414.1 guanylate cyclase 32E [Topomyia yanbarensis]XP_058835416.1 guanylate cyclase 32